MDVHVIYVFENSGLVVWQQNFRREDCVEWPQEYDMMGDELLTSGTAKTVDHGGDSRETFAAAIADAVRARLRRLKEPNLAFQVVFSKPFERRPS